MKNSTKNLDSWINVRAHTGPMGTQPHDIANNSPAADQVECWCCATTATPDKMVHLGNHPEVHLCPQCAHFVHQQAWEIEDQDRHGFGATARDRIRGLRTQVIERGWHNHTYLGAPLQWLGKHLP